MRNHSKLLLYVLLIAACNEPQRAALATGRAPERLLTTSMEPTIARNDYVFSQPVTDAADIRRHDVVIYRLPSDEKTKDVKRVVALPNETVEIRNKLLLVNGVPLNEPFAVHRDEIVYSATSEIPEPLRSRDNFGPIRLKENEMFVLGDNRDESYDSRYHGPIAGRLIVAIVEKVGPRDGPLRALPRPN